MHHAQWRGLCSLTLLVALLAPTGPADAGNIYLNGHDILLHDGQAGYDTVILDYLRCAGTPDEIPAASYSIAVLGSGVGSWGWSDVPGFGDMGAKPGYASTTFYDTNDLISSTVSWATVLSHDVLVILSHTSCGGCDLDTAGVAEINANAALISAAFNAGMDLWVNSGANEPTYYNFLPPAFATTGPSISGSTGFVATPAGAAIGITSSMINGYPTHNRFAGFSSSLTVMETRPISGGTEEIIALGAKDITLGCLEVSEETITCDPMMPGKYDYTFVVTNNSGNDAAQIRLVPKDMDGDGAPDFAMDPAVFPVSLPDGASVSITTCILGVAEDQEICFEIWLLDEAFEECCVYCHCLTTPNCCHTIVSSSIDCVPGSPGEWIYTFNLQNNAAFPIDRIFLWPLGGATLDPDEFIVPLVPTGGTTGSLSTVISGANPGDVICFDISIHNADTGECCGGATVCVTLPECDGCDVPDSCFVPDMTPLCYDPPGSPFITGMFTLRICNNCSDKPVEFEFSFEPATDDCCPEPYVDAASFSPSGGTVGPVAPGDCIEVPITVMSDIMIFPPGELSCFHVHVVNLTTGDVHECEGKLRSPREVVAKVEDPGPVDVEFGEPTTISIRFERVSGAPGPVLFEIATDSGSVAPNVSVGGLPPGTSYIDAVDLDDTGQATVNVEARLVEHDPFTVYDVLILVDVDDDGSELEVADSTAFRSVISVDCNGNGVPDDIDIAIGTSVDKDGDGVPDECGGGALPSTGSTPEFLRGDSNGDGAFDVSDVVHVLFVAFDGAPTSCESACDANDDGIIDVADPVTMLGSLFGDLGPLPGAALGCAEDLTLDSLSCDSSPCD